MKIMLFKSMLDAEVRCASKPAATRKKFEQKGSRKKKIFKKKTILANVENEKEQLRRGRTDQT